MFYVELLSSAALVLGAGLVVWHIERREAR